MKTDAEMNAAIYITAPVSFVVRHVKTSLYAY